MIMSSNRKKRATAAATGRLTMSACAALIGLAAAASAQARPLSIVTNENPAEPGAFTLSFGDLGLEARSNITSTNYELSVDAVHGTAHFVSYLQHVQPLTLPGGLSTGDIIVTVVPGSSSGSFDPITRTFTTSEMYEIAFSGDLSAFGLESPVQLPSTSIGQLAVDLLDGGEVTMDWDGAGLLSNPFDPSTPLSFTYRCAVNTVFDSTPENVVGLVLVPDVVSLSLPEHVERSLVAMLDRSLALIQIGKAARAVHSLRAFIEKVDVLSGSVIEESDAANLIAVASATIDRIGPGRTTAVAPSGPRQAK
jgi:hypothetical protein